VTDPCCGLTPASS